MQMYKDAINQNGKEVFLIAFNKRSSNEGGEVKGYYRLIGKGILADNKTS